MHVCVWINVRLVSERSVERISPIFLCSIVFPSQVRNGGLNVLVQRIEFLQISLKKPNDRFLEGERIDFDSTSEMYDEKLPT
jgi:hypothetical protein